MVHFIRFALLVTFFLAGCSTRQSTVGVKAAGRLHFTGRVVYQDIEGGFYGITDQNGKQFEPVNLPDDLKIDGLSVLVTADPLPGTPGIRMWGTVIRIVDIKRLPIPDRN